GALDAPASRSARAGDARGAAHQRPARPSRRAHSRNVVRPGVALCKVRRILMSFWSQTLTIMQKDLRAELRSKEAINASFSFALVILLLFSFAVDPTDLPTQEISGGILWIVFVFAGALVLNRSFARELPNDCLDALIAAPLPASALFLGKAMANLLLLLAIEAVSFPVFGVFYNAHVTRQFWGLALVSVLGTWGFTVIGTVFSALTVNLRLR